MTHAYKRTLLASLGFADPDKKESRHDLACQYLATRENCERLANVVIRTRKSLGAHPYKSLDMHNRDKFVGEISHELVSVGRPSLEHVVSKGTGQYRNTVGFLDVICPFSITAVRTGEADVYAGSEPIPENELDSLRLRFPPGHMARQRSITERKTVRQRIGDTRPMVAIIEVKIQPVPIGDILRQINLYREYTIDCLREEYPGVHDATWILAAEFPVSQDSADMLRREKIVSVALGKSFAEWIHNRPAPSENPAKLVEL